MFWWLKTVFAAAALIYLFTLLVGLLGNSWVIASLFRTTKKTPYGTGNSLNPSDRLRKYIWLLALLDFFVSGSLVFRVWNLLLPDQPISSASCQWMFVLDQTVKLCSLTCLSCISIERFITIRKPFNNKLRKIAIQLTPLFAFLTIAICGSAILWLSRHSVAATDDGLSCTQRDSDDGVSLGNAVAGWTLAIGFCVQLTTTESNYLRIVLHVRRKFWQRKARAVASSFSEKSLRHTISAGSGDAHPHSRHQQRISAGTARLISNKQRSSPPPLLVVAEPRYMRDMTTAIMRIAVFHLCCWLPYCVLQMVPLLLQYLFPLAQLDALKIRSAVAVRIVDVREHEWAAWTAFVANWLTYFNSAGNWVLYAALNRDLRSIIKACSERRKRSTMSQHHPSASALAGGNSPGASTALLKRSVRRTALHSLRMFYSLNSHRSSAASMDADCADGQSAATNLCGSSQPGGSSASPRTSLRAPSCSDSLRRKHSAQSSVSSGGLSDCGGARRSPQGPAELGTFGWRDGRAHTYCTPSTAAGRVDPAEQRSVELGSGTKPAPSPAGPPSTASAHMRMAQQIIAAVYNGGNPAGANGNALISRARNGSSTERERMAKKESRREGEKPQQVQGARAGQRRESAQEKRELFAQMHSPLPPIVVSMSASIDENI